MGLLRNGGRRGWEKIELSGKKSFFIERDVWQRYPSRVLHLVQCSAPVIFWFNILVMSTEQDLVLAYGLKNSQISSDMFETWSIDNTMQIRADACLGITLQQEFSNLHINHTLFVDPSITALPNII